MVKTLKIDPKPIWLLEPPSGHTPAPPVSTRKPLLPLNQLAWEDFERLCLRLSHLDGDPEHWQIYGVAGQAQGGIDVLVRQAMTDKYIVWQSKRYQKMTPTRLKSAVDLFLQSQWANKAERFVLATSADLTDTVLADEIEVQAKRLKIKQVIFDTRDATKLSEILKVQPALVDDFFDRAWTEKFCGAEAAKALGERLSRGDFERLRNNLGDAYRSHFATVDPGVLRAAGVSATPPTVLPLTARYVPPDLLAAPDAIDEFRPFARPEHDNGPAEDDRRSELDRGSQRRNGGRDRARISLETWSGDLNKAIVLGGPGAGKSTLLRYLALDMLNPDPRLSRLRERWPGLLPVWVSFPYWSRLVQDAPPGADISLEAAAVAWLGAQGQADLVGLVRRALKDKRVLLLVDGIDEWSDETAAGTALALLNSFVVAHGVPVIVTSRPHGGRVLRSLDASWRRYELAALTRAQQIEFTTAWLEHPQPENPAEATANRRVAAVRAQKLIDEIGRAAEIATLASVPLMLGGLLALTLEGANLPRSRYAAYNELCTRLLESHPRSRDQASLAQTRRGGMDPSTRRRSLASLAFHIQIGTSHQTSLEAVDMEAAVGLCAADLAHHLDLPAHLANERARQLIEVGEESLGILVKKSPTTVGFLHRAFQEFLAATHIGGLSLNAQAQLFAQHGGDPRWRDVLLFAAHVVTREADLAILVDALESANTGDMALDWSRRLLLCDLTFADIVRSASLTRRLANVAFEEVESGNFDRHRIEVLTGVISGLGGEQTALLIQPRLRTWFPKWHDWSLRDALPVIASWSEADVDAVLWRNLQSDSFETAQAAAKALTERHGKSPECKARLISIARCSSRPNTVAAALSALTFGWLGDEDISEISDAATQSQSMQIALAGLHGRIAAGRHNEKDRDRLVEWLKADLWQFNGDVARMLVLGWRDWPPLLAHLTDHGEGFAVDGILSAAIAAFPQDDRLARKLADFLKDERHVHRFHHHWRELRENFQGNAVLSKALTDHLSRFSDNDFALANGAYIVRSEAFKIALMQRQTTRAFVDFWLVDALLDIWPEDPEVRTTLADIAKRPDDQVVEIAHRLPDIMDDKVACHSRLMGLLESCAAAKSGRIDRTLEGLGKLPQLRNDEKILALALEVDPRSDYFWSGPNTLEILRQFPDAPQAVALGKDMLHCAKDLIAGIASLQGHHPEIRAEALGVAAPLSNFLRTVAISALRDRAADDDFALELLESAQRELEGSLCAAALVSVADARISRQEIPEAYLNALVSDLRAVGSNHSGRNLGAMTALGLIDRPDLVRDAIASDNFWSGGHLFSGRDYAPLLSALSRAWPRLAAAFDDRPLTAALGIDDENFLSSMAPYWDSDPDLGQALTAAARRTINKGRPRLSALRLYARDENASPALLDTCLRIITQGGRSWYEVELVFEAARVIVDDFRDSSHAFREVARLAESGETFGAVVALCDGWPDSPEFQQLFTKLAATPPDKNTISYIHPAALKIIMTSSSRSRVVENLQKAANLMTGGVWDGMSLWMPNAVRRIQREPELASDLMTVLNGAPTASETMTFASLLAAANGLTDELAVWCVARATALKDEPLASTGTDLWLSRKDVSVRARLLELIRGDV